MASRQLFKLLPSLRGEGGGYNLRDKNGTLLVIIDRQGVANESIIYHDGIVNVYECQCLRL